jgi:hypothetical protein
MLKSISFAFILAICCYQILWPEEANPPRKPLIPVSEDSMDDNLLDLSFGLELGYKQNLFWTGENVRLDFSGGPFALTADLYMSNDQKYAPAKALLPGGEFMGNYFFMNEGGLSYQTDRFFLQGGRFRVYDTVDSPYSLFISSLGNAANTLNFKYESPRFMYQSQWIELNNKNSVSSPAWNEYHFRAAEGDFNIPSSSSSALPSEFGFPDRGANYKIYAFKKDNWRFGFLDAAIYTGRSFDFEYFLNPIPQYFIQYVKVTPGRPWTTDSNENNLIGLFWDIKRRNQYDAYAQILIDDFSLGFLKFLYDGFPNTPWKFAWALGGRLDTPYGKFGFHHGGALKYTFEPITTNDAGDIAETAYGYTYYPETRYYDDNENTDNLVSILIEDNMLGYKYGENNIAFQLDYRNTFNHFLVNAELEFVIAGNNSPSNPWQDFDHSENGSKLLNDDLLEKRLEFRINISRRFGPWLFYTAGAIGGKFNKLVLQRADYTGAGNSIADEYMYIWKGSRESELIFRISVGARYTLGVL